MPGKIYLLKSIPPKTYFDVNTINSALRLKRWLLSLQLLAVLPSQAQSFTKIDSP